MQRYYIFRIPQNIFAKKVKKSKNALFFEKIIDGCVYELYFGEHMKEQEINIIDSALELIKPITNLSSDKEKADMILDVFMNIKKTDNSIRNRLDLFTLRSPEILKLIIEG